MVLSILLFSYSRLAQQKAISSALERDRIWSEHAMSFDSFSPGSFKLLFFAYPTSLSLSLPVIWSEEEIFTRLSTALISEWLKSEARKCLGSGSPAPNDHVNEHHVLKMSTGQISILRLPERPLSTFLRRFDHLCQLKRQSGRCQQGALKRVKTRRMRGENVSPLRREAHRSEKAHARHEWRSVRQRSMVPDVYDHLQLHSLVLFSYSYHRSDLLLDHPNSF